MEKDISVLITCYMSEKTVGDLSCGKSLEWSIMGHCIESD